MTITPFLTLKLRNKRDAILARQRARRVANLLCYDVSEQACIAAGVFVVACQAIETLRKARLSFQIAGGQLHVFAQELVVEGGDTTKSASNRISEHLDLNDPKALYRLIKPLPADQNIEERDLGWLVRKVEETACDGMFDEIVKQNQETLALLHELRLCRASLTTTEGKTTPPRAA